MTAHAAADEPALRWTGGAVLSAYATIYFSENPWLGGLILLCTLAAPWLGLIGLAGTLIALGAALLLGFERRYLRSGNYLFNSLLVSLAVGYIGWTSSLALAPLALLLVVASIAALLLTVGLGGFFYNQLGLPALSVPFVVVQFALVYMAILFAPIVVDGRAPHVGAPPLIVVDFSGLPAELMTLLCSFGSIIFLPYAKLGLLVLLGLLAYSRLAVLFALVGYAAGRVTLALLPLAVGTVNPLYVAFNFLFCGIALGGVFFIPSWGSMLLAAFGSALTAIVAVAEIGLFRYLGFAPLALPFNVVILSTIYALRLRTAPRLLHANPAAPHRPEENFRRFCVNRARFPHAGYPSILCPFTGQRVVTQGDDGPITHRGAWRHALDFEVPDDDGDPQSAPARLEDNHTYNTPVFSPGHGVVVKVVADVEDRPLGSNNFHHNWGNLAILYLDGGSYVKLCHLKRHSLVVAEGQRVKPGELIGYCGNSGRSPRPHLHVQLQATPRVGATTIPFRLRHYIEATADGRVYYAAGLPVENARLQGATVNDRLARLFDNLAERRYRFTTCVEPGWLGSSAASPQRPASWGLAALDPSHPTPIPARPDDEEIECSIDEFGRYLFRSTRGAELTACIVDNVFHTLDYTGPAESVLFYLWLGLGRVPFIEELGARWSELLDARPVLQPWATELATFAGPLAGYPLLRTTSRLEAADHGNVADDADFCIVCDVAHSLPAAATRCQIPTRIRLWISGTRWVVRVQSQSAGGSVTIEQTDN